MDIDSIRRNICDYADEIKDRLKKLSLKIHDAPEVGMEERLASEWLCQELRSEGFDVEKGVAGMDTAFTGKLTLNVAAPRLGFLAEYDALPGIGHGCGHNLIGPAAIGTAIVLKKVLPRRLLNIIVYGSPAEENAGGKVYMLEKGLFHGTSAVMMFHPHNEYIAAVPCMGRTLLVLEFFGKSAHASVFPWNGINALDALILTFNNINALRQHIKEDARIHGIITNGGSAANIVPDYTRAEFYVRSRDIGYMEELVEKVRSCAQAASLATGAGLKISSPLPVYLSDKKVDSFAQAVEGNMARLGLEPEKPLPPLGYGSSDFGNVSREVPAVQMYIKIAPKGISTHSKAFAEAAATEAAFDAMINAVKVMALTACDILIDPSLLDRIQRDFL